MEVPLYSFGDGQNLRWNFDFHRSFSVAFILKKQSLIKDERARLQMEQNINGIRSKGYIWARKIWSLSGYFLVDKGEDDICLVNDSAKCGLNDALWTPNFGLPTIDSTLRNADLGTWFGDIILGEMFLSYWLDELLRPYVGVDVSTLGCRSLDKYEKLENEDGRDGYER